MRSCLFEDRAEQLKPLALTRPVFDLRCGMVTLRQKLLRHVGESDWGVLIRPELKDLYRLQHPDAAVNDADWLSADDVILVNGRWLPPEEAFEIPRDSCVGTVGAEVAYCRLNEGLQSAICNLKSEIAFDQLPMLLEACRHTLPSQPAGGRMIAYPWDLVDRNADEIRRDFRYQITDCRVQADQRPANCNSLAVLGPPENLWIAASARIEPMVVADTTQGPVVIDENAVVSAFTRLEGPCYVGPGTQVLGAKVRGGTSLGPECRVGGEIEASILHGYSNKYHEGFLGHSYVGAWVNLGAGTHNSDLRNDYGEVTMTLHGSLVLTGMTKVGCFLGDHTKTGLGTLLNTGTNVGAFCNLLPAGRFAPKYVPSFTTWWNGSLREAFTLDQLLATAQIAMKRRGVTLMDAHKALYARLLEETQEERRRVLRESQQREMRRSA
jgi:UDP-N-acetylglucosamine diphosphorylase / glucose-1-phosphate thymidylyltransferase / UDP-N-acetylgalactosamine diphosphorylase / glucosamine-1-phosphate N-acetyltransferase / galactosamine-1-phosphate N-acetyltransferase